MGLDRPRPPTFSYTRLPFCDPLSCILGLQKPLQAYSPQWDCPSEAGWACVPMYYHYGGVCDDSGYTCVLQGWPNIWGRGMQQDGEPFLWCGEGQTWCGGGQTSVWLADTDAAELS
jgi:hypothetical protein